MTPTDYAQHKSCHDDACQGDRTHARGAIGIGCTCRGRDRWQAETIELVQRLGNELRQLAEPEFEGGLAKQAYIHAADKADAVAALLAKGGADGARTTTLLNLLRQWKGTHLLCGFKRDGEDVRCALCIATQQTLAAWNAE
jgi:hypothetical protein